MPPRKWPEPAAASLAPAVWLLPGSDPTAPWWRKDHPVYWAPHFLVALLILLAQPEWFLNHRMRDLYEQLETWFPFLKAHRGIGLRAEMSHAMRCLWLVVAPGFAALPFFLVWRGRHQCLRNFMDQGDRQVPWRIEVTAVVMLTVTILAHLVLPGDPGGCKGCMVGARLGIAFTNLGSLIVVTWMPIVLATALYVRIGLRFANRRSP